MKATRFRQFSLSKVSTWLLLKLRAIVCRDSVSGRHCVHMRPLVPGGVPMELLFHTYRNNLLIQGHKTTRTKAKVQAGLYCFLLRMHRNQYPLSGQENRMAHRALLKSQWAAVLTTLSRNGVICSWEWS